jgi:hypothetical protein
MTTERAHREGGKTAVRRSGGFEAEVVATGAAEGAFDLMLMVGCYRSGTT